jgi:hypothetical protein
VASGISTGLLIGLVQCLRSSITEPFLPQLGKAVSKLRVQPSSLLLFKNIARASRVKLKIHREIEKQAALYTNKKYKL